MPVRAFAVELRKQCARFESISKVCEGTAINRQQFNKYLAAQAFPSARNMRKICQFLGVSEEQLLSGKTAASRAAHTAGERPALKDPFFRTGPEIDSAWNDNLGSEDVGEWLSRAPGRTEPRPLPAGHFACYFPLHPSSDLLLRSLLTLKMQGGRMTFVRRTYVNTIEGGERFAMRAKHHGLVVSTARETFMFGTNTLPPFQPSILSVQTVPITGQNYFTGLALTRGLESQVATTVVLQYLGAERFARHALAELGTVSRWDSSLDPVVARLTQAQAAAGQSHIQWLDVKSLLAGNLTGGSNLVRSKEDRRLVG